MCRIPRTIQILNTMQDVQKLPYILLIADSLEYFQMKIVIKSIEMIRVFKWKAIIFYE